MKQYKVSLLLLTASLGIHTSHASFAAQQPAKKAAEEQPGVDLARTIIPMGERGELLPAKALLDLLGKTGVKHNGNIGSIEGLKAWRACEKPKEADKSILIATQGKDVWLRPTAEREDAPEIHAKMRAELIPLYSALGMLQVTLPKQTHYDHVIVLSNMVKPFRQRLAFVHKLHDLGIEFGKIHLVGSERPLSAVHESEKILMEAANTDLPFRKDWQQQGTLPTYDTEMLKMVYAQGDFTASFRQIPCTPLNVANVKRPDGTESRATTGTQVTEWVKNNGDKGTTLWISNNPYNAYQDSVVRTYAPSTLQLETAGPKADKDKPNLNADCLDTVARIIYQEAARAAATKPVK